MKTAMRGLVLLILAMILAQGCAKSKGMHAHLMMLPGEERVATVIGQSMLESLLESDTLSNIPGEVMVIVPPLTNDTHAEFDGDAFTTILIRRINDSGQNKIQATPVGMGVESADARYVLAGVLKKPAMAPTAERADFLVCQFSLMDADNFSVTPWQAAWVVPLIPAE